MRRQLVTQNGESVSIGAEIGRGGEGAVYQIQSQSNQVLKLYHSPVKREKAIKLAAMVRLQNSMLRSFSAWPEKTVHHTQGGPTVGLVMPKVGDTTEIHELYSPAQRKSRFPDRDWRFLLRTALNCAAAFDELHKAGVVIGDVNQGNLLVDDDAQVKLIDCDSFQIQSSGELFKCSVGVMDYTPPELNSFSDERTANHDNFGLAVIVFQLLMMGRHPFSGKYNQGVGEMPLERAIKQNRFAYGHKASHFKMERPPHSVALTDLTSDVSSLFEQAFADPSLRNIRPTAKQWCLKLRDFEKKLQRCVDYPGHYKVAAGTCQWCRIASGGGPDYFATLNLAQLNSRKRKFDRNKLWREIKRVESPRNKFPRAARPIDHLTAKPLPKGILPSDEPALPGTTVQDVILTATVVDTAFATRKLVLVSSCAVGLGMALLCLTFSSELFLFFSFITSVSAIALLCDHLLHKHKQNEQRKNDEHEAWVGKRFVEQERLKVVEERKRIRERRKQECDMRVRALEHARSRLKQSQTERNRAESRAAGAFDAKLRTLREVIACLNNLPSDYKKEKRSVTADLSNQARELQKEAFLETQFIRRCKIKGIGRSRLADLESYGIETAADISFARVSQVPGFGPTLARSVVDWRQAREREFNFSPVLSDSQQAIGQLQKKYSMLQSKYEFVLKDGAKALQVLKEAGHAEVLKLDQECVGHERVVRQAEMDLRVRGLQI